MYALCGMLAALFFCAAQPAVVTHVSHELHAWAAGEEAKPPWGWVDFCKRLPTECVAAASEVEYVLTPAAWQELGAVNDVVNLTVKPKSDMDNYGVPEYWTYPDNGYGDCEDYVLLKRRMLMQRGWPSSVLLITVVIDASGVGHAVLLVRTDQADFVLNNQTGDILPWNETAFRRYVKRQSAEDPNKWVHIQEQDPPVVASLRQP